MWGETMRMTVNLRRRQAVWCDDDWARGDGASEEERRGGRYMATQDRKPWP